MRHLIVGVQKNVKTLRPRVFSAETGGAHLNVTALSTNLLKVKMEKWNCLGAAKALLATTLIK